MENLSLQFQGVRDAGLLGAVMAVVAACLAAYGVAQLFRRRTRRGILCLAGALPAAVALPLSGQIGAGLWLAAVGLQVALAVGLFYAAVYAYLGRRRLAVLMALRWAAVAALLLILFKPALSIIPDADARRPRIAILVDRSQSMATVDQGDASRYVQCLRRLQSQEDRLRRSFRPIYYPFACAPETAESVSALARLQPSGEGTETTDIAAALNTASNDFDKASLAGILLLSDGLHNAGTDLPKSVEELKSGGLHVFIAGVGAKTEGAGGRKDLQIASVAAPFDALRNNAATIHVTVKSTGLPNVPAEVQLLEEGNVVASAPVRTDQAEATLACDLKWTPRELPGSPAAATGPAQGPADVRKLKVFVPPAPEEAVKEDNSSELHVLVTEPKVRLLYVEGTIRPEYKFLWRALGMDPQVQLLSLVRVQKSEFSVTGSIGGKTLKDLPRTDEDFHLFDVIILGDLDATFFTSDQMQRLRKFVQDGGGLLMLGGHNSFGPGGWGGTEVESVLPVTTGGRSQGQETDKMLPLLTAEGAKHPIFDGVADYLPTPAGPPKPSLPKLPELLGCVKVIGPKPGATILAVLPAHPDEIVLAVQAVGAGRSAAFTADTTWQWYMALQGKGEESPYRLFWGQLVRWLANVQIKNRAGGGSLVLRLDTPLVKAGAKVGLSARVLNEQGKPASTATVTCTVEPIASAAGPGKTPPAGVPPRPQTVTLAYNSTSGLFEGAFPAAKEGPYAIRASAVEAASQTAFAKDDLSLGVLPSTPELDVLARDEAKLRMIADRTGGRYADVSGLAELVDEIIDRQKSAAPPAARGEIRPLYSFPILFVVFVALLTCEWLLRRSWQLQ